MPRRQSPDPISTAVGARIRALREESGLTQERLAYESDLGSKGHLSSIEAGRVRPTVHTLKVLADGLGVLALDLLCFPSDDARQRLVDLTRKLPAEMINRWLLEAIGTLPQPVATPPRRRRRQPRS